mmetsp:Transcript_4032/g.9500  ORF Transcript_4032/g.9500 Transcript_4032/m.9500 type:complete len:99 (+) Transcript_4032:308-604(+)
MSAREEDKKQEGENLTRFWIVKDQFQFENVGVSKAASVDDAFRYLACADCDQGPIGIRMKDKPNEWLIAHDRVHYYTPSSTPSENTTSSTSSSGPKAS